MFQQLVYLFLSIINPFFYSIQLLKKYINPHMLAHQRFAGCNPKINSSCVYNNKLYFCSSQNIMIADENDIIDVIYLNNELNFVKAYDDIIITGDVSGNFYCIQNSKISSYKFDESLQNSCFVTRSCFLINTLKSAFLFSFKEHIIKTHHFEEIITACSSSDNIILLGTSTGFIYIFNTSLDYLDKFQAHYDRIQDLSLNYISNELFLASSSKDDNIKVWILEKEKFLHVQTLQGHKDWVFKINWVKEKSLISSSADCKIILWEYGVDNNWNSTLILGGAKYFYNAFYINNKIIAQSATGGFYKFIDDAVDYISGHTDEISSIDWNGEFIITSSLDKTNRLFYRNREVYRPQTHGYAISSAKFLEQKDLTFISGGYETIMRVMEPTQLCYLCVSNMNDNIENNSSSDDFSSFFENIGDYKAAALPAELSLTNDVAEDYSFESLNEYLLTETCFFESKKIYGHFFEVMDIAVSKNFIASCNRSLLKKFAGIFLWNKKFEMVQCLEQHDYSVIKLKFSPDGKYLCSVSKDKSSSIYIVTNKLTVKYRNFEHKRIIWDCSFSHDSRYYVTCSRDKHIYIYDLKNNNKIIFNHHFSYEVTSVDFSPIKYELAVGLENGVLVFFEYKDNKFYKSCKREKKLHSLRINVVKYSPDGKKIATGGKDGLLNIFTKD